MEHLIAEYFVFRWIPLFLTKWVKELRVGNVWVWLLEAIYQIKRKATQLNEVTK